MIEKLNRIKIRHILDSQCQHLAPVIDGFTLWYPFSDKEGFITILKALFKPGGQVKINVFRVVLGMCDTDEQERQESTKPSIGICLTDIG